jgi:AbrB family looped-hinge helix DNA binding protein
MALATVHIAKLISKVMGNTMLHTSKLTSKFQATVPTPVRKALQLKAGDTVGFEVEGQEVKLRRATPLDMAFAEALEGTLGERSSLADEHAFKDLYGFSPFGDLIRSILVTSKFQISKHLAYCLAKSDMTAKCGSNHDQVANNKYSKSYRSKFERCDMFSKLTYYSKKEKNPY